jgi:hypothetical protein
MTKIICGAIMCLALIAAGCGKDERADYVHAINDAVDTHGQNIANLSASIDPASPKATDAPIYDQQAEELRALSRDLSSVKVPKDFPDTSDLRGAVDAAAQDVQNADTMTAEEFGSVIQIDSTRIDTARKALNSKLGG